MKKLSLKFRIFSAAALALLIFIPLIAFALEKAHVASLNQAMLERMRVQTLTLISEFEITDNVSYMPEVMINGQFNLPDSGLYGLITGGQQVIWHSLSALNWHIPKNLPAPPSGQEHFKQIESQGDGYFVHSYTAEFELDVGFSPYHFHSIQDMTSFNAEVKEFRTTLWYWLGIIAVLLLLMLLFALNTALKPIHHLVAQINAIQEGKSKHIQAQYPSELETLKNNLNHLLEAEANQRERYKNSLSDLAHSLKTPLAVLSGLPDLPSTGREPVEQIDNIIQRQLKRAVAGTGSGWSQAEPVVPIVEKLKGAMLKVYRDKELDIRVDIDPEIRFYGDHTDLLELMGNLLDNACKAAQYHIEITATSTPLQITLIIADDGPGIAEADRELLLQRGQRLDSYATGQGIGMAVVSDLIAAYQGQLFIKDSDLGGAQIEVEFPLPATS